MLSIMRDEKFYNAISVPLRQFLLDKYKTIRKASEHLDIDYTLLSKILNAVRKPDPKLTLKIIQIGFDKQYFDEYYMLTKLSPDALTKEELIKLIGSQNIYSQQLSETINKLMHRIDQLERSNDALRRELLAAAGVILKRK